MEFLGMGWLEILVVAIVGLLVLGPDRLPEYARKAGRFIRQFRKITSGVTKEINKALELDEWDGGDGLKQELKDISKSLEEDAAQLRKSLSGEAASLEETVNKGVEDFGKSLTKGSADIMDSLSETTKSAGKDLSVRAEEDRQNLKTATTTSPDAVVDYKPPPLPEDI